MKKIILKHLIVTGYMKGIDYTDCELSVKKLEDAQEKMKEAKKNVKTAKKELNLALKESVRKLKESKA